MTSEEIALQQPKGLDLRCCWSERIFDLSLVVATLVFLLTSYFGEKLGWAPELILALNIASYLAGGTMGVREAWPTLRERRLDINILMLLAAVGAALIDQWHEGAILLFLFSLSSLLEEYAMDRSRNAIGGLLKLRPDTARVVRDGAEHQVAVDDLVVGDRLIIRPGELMPTDGTVIAGTSDVNEASLTGESVPVDKSEDHKVFAGTLNGQGTLEVAVTAAAGESTLARVIKLVEEAREQKARTQHFLEAFEPRYAWGVILGVMLAMVVPWALLKQPFEESFYRAMVLMVVASPCALIISTPAAILSAIARGARRGVLFKGGAHLENLARIKVVAFDKTGTLTEGRPRLTDMILCESRPEGFAENDLLAIAAALESRSEHPIAQAILAAAVERGLELPVMEHFSALAGRGVHARVDGLLLWIGGARMFEEHDEKVPADLLVEKSRLEAEGKTVLIIHREIERNGNVGEHEDEGGWLGLVAVADTIRPGVREVVERLRGEGIEHVVMLTGDNEVVAGHIAELTGVDEVAANLMPEHKVEIVHELRERYGPVLMIGDGVNDAPALAAADIGAAMGAAGSDVALENADLVLMADDLDNIPFALHLSRRTRRIVWQNISFALAVIVLLILGVFFVDLPLPLGVVGHEGSTLLVVANGLRLLGR